MSTESSLRHVSRFLTLSNAFLEKAEQFATDEVKQDIRTLKQNLQAASDKHSVPIRKKEAPVVEPPTVSKVKRLD